MSFTLELALSLSRATYSFSLRLLMEQRKLFPRRARAKEPNEEGGECEIRILIETMMSKRKEREEIARLDILRSSSFFLSSVLTLPIGDHHRVPSVTVTTLFSFLSRLAHTHDGRDEEIEL